jgi:hypothetical protein
MPTQKLSQSQTQRHAKLKKRKNMLEARQRKEKKNNAQG